MFSFNTDIVQQHQCRRVSVECDNEVVHVGTPFRTAGAMSCVGNALDTIR